VTKRPARANGRESGARRRRFLLVDLARDHPAEREPERSADVAEVAQRKIVFDDLWRGRAPSTCSGTRAGC